MYRGLNCLKSVATILSLICPNGALALAYLVRNGAEKQEGQKTGPTEYNLRSSLFFSFR